MSLQSLKYRFATEQDASSIVVLVNSAYRGEISKKGWTTEADFVGGQRIDAEMVHEILQKPDTKILMAFNGENLVGVMQIAKQAAGNGYFGMFSVDPTLQGGGVGNQMLSYAETWMKENWNVTIIKMIVITIRQSLIEWYERRGYVFTNETKPFHTDQRFGIPMREDLLLGVWQKNLSDPN